MSNIAIAQRANMQSISLLARERLGIPEESLELYGRFKAKVSLEYIASINERPDGKLILVTAISPTPAGEGKTTTTVGLCDAMIAHAWNIVARPGRARGDDEERDLIPDESPRIIRMSIQSQWLLVRRI